MNPVFAPKRLKLVEADIQTTARRLVDSALAKGQSEFISDFAEVFPVTIFLSLMGLPHDHTSQFLAWEHGILHTPDLETRIESTRAVRDYLATLVRDRRKRPADDLISFVIASDVAGRPVTDQEATSMCLLLFMAGLDTVTAALGFIFKHLAEHPGHQQQLRDDPSLIPGAIEELLRAYPLAVGNRVITRDVEFHGVTMKAGERISMPTMLAGRDANTFAQPDVVEFRREGASHITFAAGPHRCLGSHLARRELKCALEEWLNRAPPFRVKSGETPRAHASAVFGVDYLPLTW
jgi:cytochrome P450